MKIYTKTGDKGETSLLGGTRVSKSHIRIEAYGTLDELNSYLGLLADQRVNSSRRDFVLGIQNDLFAMGSMLATDPKKSKVKIPPFDPRQIEGLEKEIDFMDSNLPELRNFILPGGHESVSTCHVARSVCRRAERAVIRLSETNEVDEVLIKYLNRLSDYLFVLARKMSGELNVGEVIWRP